MKTMNLSYKLYLPHLQKDCIQIFRSNVPTYFSKNEQSDFLEWLQNKSRDAYYVYYMNDQPIACGGIFSNNENKEAGLAWGMVDQGYHKNGFGKQITLHRLELLDQLYADYIHKLVTIPLTAGFYQKMGFRIALIIPDGFGHGQDKVIMVRA